MRSESRRRGCIGWLLRLLKRILLGLLAFVVSLTLIGAAYQAIAERYDRQRFPPPGRMVDVGGYRLHLYCTGSGGPTVVMDAGLGDFWLDWSRVQPDVAKFTQVCTYDRAGTGWSDPGPAPRDARHVVADWHTLMVKSGIPGPYVLVGHSLGGFHARLYATTYPDEVAGLVLVDPTPTYGEAELEAKLSPQQRQELARYPAPAPPSSSLLRTGLRYFAYVGGVRLLGKQTIGTLTPLPEVPLEAQPTYQAVVARSSYMGEYFDELDIADASTTQVRDTTRSLGDIPVVVLAHGLPGMTAEKSTWTPRDRLVEPAEEQLQAQLARTLSTNGSFVLASRSGHYIQFDQPDLVIDAIRRVVTAARGT